MNDYDDPPDTISPPVTSRHVGLEYRRREVELAAWPVLQLIAERPASLGRIRDNLPISYTTIETTVGALARAGQIMFNRGVWRVVN